jgi:drug/metabolite transporter (DMT)-like permease
MGTLILLPFYLWELGETGMMELSAASLGSIAYVGVVASVAAFFLWGKGVAALGAARAGLYLHLMPVFTSVLAFSLLGESIARGTMMGAPLVLLGIGMVSRSPH